MVWVGSDLPMGWRVAFDCVLGAWRAHEAELRGYLIHRLGNVAGAEDLLQETFLKSLRLGADFCVIDNPRAWLFKVARNAVIDQARLAKPQVALPDDLPATADEPLTPVDALDACLRRNLAQMSDEDRQIIEQCDLQGVRQADFAKAHKLSLPAAKSRLLRARKRLRDALMQNCQVRFDESGAVCCHVPQP